MSRPDRMAATNAQHRDSGWSHSGDSERLSERVWTDLRKALYDLAGQARNTVERKITRYAASFVFSPALDLTFLATKITGVLHGGFGARDIERRVEPIGLEEGEPLLRKQVGESNFRLTK